MRITAIRPQRRNAERVSIDVDGEFRLGVARQLVLDAALAAGDEVSDSQLEALEQSDVGWKAREAALNLLSHRQRSRTELRDRLVRKGYAPEIAEDVVGDMVERGYLDDAAFAESFVRDRVRLRPRGRRRLLDELRTKGVTEAIAGKAVEQVFGQEDVSDTELASQAARAWARRSLRGPASSLSREERDRARRRLYAYLARRGFAGEPLRRAMDDVL